MRFTDAPTDTALQSRHHAANCKLTNAIANLPRAGWRDGKPSYKVDSPARLRLIDARTVLVDLIERNRLAGELNDVYHGESVPLIERTDEILEATREPLHLVTQ